MPAACVDNEEEDGEDTERDDGAEEDDTAGVRAVVVPFSVGSAVGWKNCCVCCAHDC